MKRFLKRRVLTLNSIFRYLIWFFLYSFIGWLWETLLFTVREKRFVNRGFLFGPLCPIYGVGAVICILTMYNRVNEWWLIFIIGLFACTLLEYGTHYILEKLFHATWWDYKNAFLNINGRICLSSSLAFGACITLLIKVVQPAAEDIIDSVPVNAVNGAAFIFYTVLVADITVTVSGMVELTKRLQKFQRFIEERVQHGINFTEEKSADLAERIQENEHAREIIKKISSFKPARIIKTYSHMRSISYSEALEAVRKEIRKNRKD